MHPITGVMAVAGMLPRADIREAITALRVGLEQSGLNEGSDACPLRHTFVDGVYAREITMYEGQTVIGRIHRHPHLNFIMQGRVRVLTEHEGDAEYAAPCMFVSQPGTQRVVHILEDCVWVTVHPTEQTDPDAAVQELTTTDHADIEVSTTYEVML